MLYTTKELSIQFESYIKDKISTLATLPTLYVIQIGNDFASSKYVSIKQQKCQHLGLPVIIKTYPNEVDPSEVEEFIKEIPVDGAGVILQLPVAAEFAYLVDKIESHKDIDLLSSQSVLLTTKGVLSPTIGAIDLVLKQLLRHENISFAEMLGTKANFKGKTVAVIGQGKLIGNPLLTYLKEREATIISINKDTRNAQELTKHAEIIITAAGVENLIDDKWINDGTILIDAATLESSGSQKGDVNKVKIRDSVILCPSPGGIGSLTVLYLLFNLIQVSDRFKR